LNSSPAAISYAELIEECDRGYDLGRKHAKEELADTIATYEKLYALVEAYVCTPNTNPAVAEAYDNLITWFIAHSRPDGSPPLPVASGP